MHGEGTVSVGKDRKCGKETCKNCGELWGKGPEPLGSENNSGGKDINWWVETGTVGKRLELWGRDWNCRLETGTVWKRLELWGIETGTSGMEAQMRGRADGIGQEHMIGRLVLLESFRHLKAVFVQDIFLRI